MEVTNKQIRDFIRTNPRLTNREVGEELGVKWTIVRANRAHVTMKTDTDEPQPRKKGSERKKPSNITDKTKFVKDGDKKLDARVEIMKMILWSKLTKGNILSLCGESVQIELNLETNKTQFRYDFVDFCPNVFKRILARVSQTTLDVNSISNCPLAKKIYEAKENQYAHLIYDYCGRLETFKEEIEYTFKNNILQKGGTVSLTFSSRGSKPIVDVEPVKGEAITYTAAKAYFSSFKGYRIVKSFKYKDSADMMVFIIKRDK